MIEVYKFKLDGVLIPVKFTKTDSQLKVQFPYHAATVEEIKTFEGARWHPETKYWTVADSLRNKFRIAYLCGQNPYEKYDREWVNFQTNRSLYKHQKLLTRHGLTVHCCIWAAEMGTGKTLAAIELMEHSGIDHWWWVAPKSALVAAKLEFHKWQSKIKPEIFTYEGFKKTVVNWEKGKNCPKAIIFDESSRLKTWTAERTQAASYFANAIRNEHGDGGFVIEMSGSPAPKSPVDWWSICEIACPGFIREGRLDKFRNRLALFQMEESITGGKYPRLITWYDDERKCAKCGRYQDYDDHNAKYMTSGYYHEFIPSRNEVAYLYERMKGLVQVVFKKDCTDLPDKIYRKIQVQPTREILNAAKIAEGSEDSAIKVLTRLRELSDGFQYIENEVGKTVCPACNGARYRIEKVYKGPEGEEESSLEYWKDEERACSHCKGIGLVAQIERIAVQIPCPKEEATIDILDEHDEIGRLVIYGGFTGSIDRLISIAKKHHWNYIRVDGRGWDSDIDVTSLKLKDPITSKEANDDLKLTYIFQDKTDDRKIVFIGQPGAAGMGLTLTASPTILYYSNDFNAESRIQSEDRIHRPGMDVNRGATIIDIVHLPSDELVLENLQKKRDLQSMTLGDMKMALDRAKQKVRIF